QDRERGVVPEPHRLRAGHRCVQAERISGDVVPVRLAADDLEPAAERRVEQRCRRCADAAGEGPSLDRVAADDRSTQSIAGPEADLAKAAPEVEELARLDDR